MKMKILSCAVAAVLVSGMALQAQLPVSKTSGIELTTLTDGQFATVTHPYSNTPVARGTVTAVASETVTLDVPAGTFTGLSGDHVARIVTGPNAGLVYPVASPSGTQIDMTGLGVSDLAVNLTQVEVIKLKTLDEAFPNGGSFTGGASPGSADQLILPNGSNIAISYYNTTVGEWRTTADVANGSTQVLPYNGSILVRGAVSGAGSVLASGIAPTADQKYTLTAGQFTAVGNPYGQALTLGDLTSQLTAGPSAGAADQVIYPAGANIVLAYRNSTASEWQVASTGALILDTTSVGSGFLVRAAANGVITLNQ